MLTVKGGRGEGEPLTINRFDNSSSSAAPVQTFNPSFSEFKSKKRLKKKAKTREKREGKELELLT